MTITRVNATVVMSILAAIGDIKRFSSPQKLVSCFGFNNQVRPSGDKLAYHDGTSKQRWTHAKSMLAEAACRIAGQVSICSSWCHSRSPIDQ
jgi:transposase